MKTFSLSVISALLFTVSAQGQSWRVAPTIGLNSSYISYSSAFRSNLNAGGRFDTKTGPLVRVQVGALLDYTFSDRFSIRSGLTYTGKGGSLRFDASQYGVIESIRGGYQFDYLEIPLLLNFAVGRRNWRIIGGAVVGATLSAKGIVNGGNFSGYGYYQGNTTNLSIGNGVNQIRPFDLCTTVGYVKEIELADQSLELGIYFQHALTSWNTSAKTQPDFYARNGMVGIRAAYFFMLRR